MKFQLIAVEYTGLKFTKGAFNPKPKALEEGTGEGLRNLYLQILSNIKNSQFMSYWMFWVQILILSKVLFFNVIWACSIFMFDKICKYKFWSSPPFFQRFGFRVKDAFGEF